MYVLDKRNTLWLRCMVRQTSLGKSAAGADLQSAGRPLTSLRMSAWPYCITTKYSYLIWSTSNILVSAPKALSNWIHHDRFHPYILPFAENCDSLIHVSTIHPANVMLNIQRKTLVILSYESFVSLYETKHHFNEIYNIFWQKLF